MADPNKAPRVIEAFSNGQFELAYPYLAENVEWIVIGKKHFEGKKALILIIN